MKTKPIVKITVAVLVVLLVALLLLLYLVFALFFVNIFKGAKAENERKLFTYQFLQTDASMDIENSVTCGIMKIFKEVKENEYLSYQDEKGNHFLVSNFGMNEYKCTGHCFCNDEHQEFDLTRKSVAIVKNTVKYLVAAVSVSMAYQLSKEHFIEECENKVKSDEPSCSSVTTEVDDCDPIEVDEDREDDGLDRRWKVVVVHAYVSGKVQGVKFRESVRQKSLEIGKVTGWVRNLLDGRVECLAEIDFDLGHEARIEEFVQFLWRGPPLSRVDDVDHYVNVGEDRNFDEFLILGTM